MKDRKTVLLLCVSFLLLVTSMVLLWTWMYYKPSNSLLNNRPNGNAREQRLSTLRSDSIMKLLSSLEKEVYNRDTLLAAEGADKRNALSNALQTFYTLRSEIYKELNATMSEAEFSKTTARILFLQDQISRLNKSQKEIEAENKRLATLVTSLKNTGTVSFNQVSTTPVNSSAIGRAAALPKENLAAWDLNLIALKEDEKNGIDNENTNTDPEQLIASFVAKNGSESDETVEFFIVIVQPDGTVLQKGTWESGTFNTSTGRKIYSGKIKAGYSGGEVKKATFKIATERFQKGNYSLQLYRNGQMIAKTNKNLS